MSESFQSLLAGIVAHPTEDLRWLILADWLDDHGQCDRALLLRIHRELLRTCTEPHKHPERQELHARMMRLLRNGVRPCVPTKIISVSRGSHKADIPFSFIPPGTFWMGSLREKHASRDELPHLVTLTHGFWLATTPVTWSQAQALVGHLPEFYTTLCDNRPQHPATILSVPDARAMCRVIDARLPTEAEWEYACRAGTTTPFYWGKRLNGRQAKCNGYHPYGTANAGPRAWGSQAVGAYAVRYPHPWGLADMSGNVREWCADVYASYPMRGYRGTVPVSDPVKKRDGFNIQQVVRGGCFLNCPAACRSAKRGKHPAHTASAVIGVRMAVDLQAMEDLGEWYE